MSAPQSNAPSWIQELKSNRRTQAALVAMALTGGWIYWSTSTPPKGRPKAASPFRAGTRSGQGDAQMLAIQGLPDLEKLDKAGELPGDEKMYRDLFIFDTPPPKPQPAPKVEPIKPVVLSAEQIAAAQLQRAREAEWNSRPQNLRYLGYLGTKTTGRIGAFMKGEDPVSYKVGETPSAQWRLVKLTDMFAEFQSLKYADMLHKIESKDAQGSQGSRPSNEY